MKSRCPRAQDQPCLSPDQIKVLAGYGVRLEEHYHGPQDVEWALDQGGRLMVLQSRPLVLQAPTGKELQDIPAVTGYPVLVEGGAAAFPGVGCGPAFLVQGDEDLLNFPDGAVLVARHSSPKFVVVMAKAQAIVTVGEHFRPHGLSLPEFSLPTLLDTRWPPPPRPEVAVDAYTARQGQVGCWIQPLRESPETRL
jgi:pyruvate,water dikinase